MIETILGIVVVVSLLLLILTLISNKFQFAIIKIEQAEEEISLYLDTKKNLLDRTRPIVTKELKLEEFLPELDQNFEEISNFDEHDILKKAYNDLYKIIDENDKLLKSEALSSILKELNDNEEDIIGAIKYYNNTVVTYNKLVLSFPSNIIGFFKGCKKKAFYNNEKKEMFEILNENRG